ncbi:hypothetical protein SADUNF_Sadunf05G0091000 [Salix dunnii]|uniref:Uncharacterized protein n=1 Tax=Salix dunnii TaxID=1413687 RepID=A0A835N243_9ROSI|nr:hypothetical protein SADUNF_Sadunf05G0091000 [Salix dunnii]
MRDRNHKNGAFGSGSPIQSDLPRNISPLKNSRRHSSIYDDYSTEDSVFSPPRRRHSSKSPYKTQRDDDGAEQSSKKNVSPLPKPDQRSQVSSYRWRFLFHPDSAKEMLFPFQNQNREDKILLINPGERSTVYMKMKLLSLTEGRIKERLQEKKGALTHNLTKTVD